MRAAVLGSPIAHSLSPVLHRAAYSALGLDWDYAAIEVDADGLPAFVDACGPEWRGLSLTMPLKTAVLPLLESSSDVVNLVGAANTVVFADGERCGHNTDVPGMRRAIAEVAGPDFSPRTATIIGGGATARSAVAAAAMLGATDVHLALRTIGRVTEFDDLSTRLGISLHPHGWQEGRHHLESDVVIATTPPGTVEHLATAVPARPGILLDVAYGAGRSALLTAWIAAGGAAAGGLDLLLWQAAEQVTLMTGREAPIEAMRAAMRASAEGA